jgi:CHAD domain-containing protein
MAYRLKGRKPVATELSRIVAKEFDKALEELSGNSVASSGEAVYEARKSVKKIRAVLRLLRTDLGDPYGTQNRRLRNIAHQLAPLRDVDATAEIVKSLRDHYPRLLTRSVFTSVYRGFLARKRRVATRLDASRLLPGVMRNLRRMATSTVRQVRRVADADAVTTGIRRGYRRARNAMGQVHAHPEDVRLHAWRRRVKDHWYHMRLLEDLNGHAHRRARRLKRLERWLGDDHNLVLMRATILNAPTRFGDQRATTLVLGCGVKYQMALRRRALNLGDRLFKDKPRVFHRSIDAWLHKTRARH